MTSSRLLSIQVGQPADHGPDSVSKKAWRSGIFKFPAEGRVWLDALNLQGDAQDDRNNHGGPYRAVLAYSAEHYPQWRAELQHPDLPFGAFGENFTVTDLTEETVCIGDIYAVGDVQIQVTQPRQPCWKLARRWGIKDLTKRVQEKAQGGWYHRALKEGYVEPGQTVTLVERPYPRYNVRTVFALMNNWIDDPQLLSELSTVSALSEGWREHFASLVSSEVE